MKNTKGITLISLVITIIVLLILASIATYSGINIINSSRLTAFTTELKIMQTQVNTIYQKYKDNETIEIDGNIYYGETYKNDTTKRTILDMGQELTGGTIGEQANKVFEELIEDTESGIKLKEGYLYWSNDLIKKLGIEGIEQDYFINVEKRSIVSYEGLKYEDKMYYTLKQLPNNLYNVDYSNPNQGKPTFEVKTAMQGDSKWRVDITNIKYESGYIEKWQVKYKTIDEKDNWNTTEDLSFIVNEAGSYSIMLVNGEIKSETQIISIANAPELKDGMQAIKFASDGTERQVADSSKDEWYSYEITTDDDMTDGGTTEGGNSKWANATLNGNYYVWIPRYAYKIDNSVTYKSQSGISHKIDVKFIGTNVTSSNVATKVGEGYIVHPAFTFGTQELSGFWVGKYETTGDITTPTILPNETSLRSINISTMFSTAQKLSTANYDSHMMKNTEWGAVAYLAQSPYGRNGTEISVNQCSSYYTGVGAGTGGNKIFNSTYTWDNITDNQKYNGSIGKLASTTGNIYGVYDMSGGAYEYVMGFYETNGMPEAGNTGFATFPESKYYDLYASTSSEATNIGDALFETKGWNGDNDIFVDSGNPVFRRGGYYDQTIIAGPFYFFNSNGGGYIYFSFRVCLIVR